MIKIQKLLFVFIVFIAAVLRFSALDQVPPSLHADEAAEGFNAYSILKTGKDMYGQSFPLLFRANGSYQPPVYTYLSTIPTLIWGNSMFTIRFISALSGVILTIVTFLLVSNFSFKKRKNKLFAGLIAAGIVAISPWSIHFSRLAAEANLGVLIFVIGLLFLLKSLNKISFFPLATLILGFSTHVYYSERVIVVLFLGITLLVFRKTFIKNLKVTVLGLLIFGLAFLPHLYLLSTGALTKRLDQVSYLTQISQSSLGLFEKIYLMFGEFINHYLIYFSPKNLFFDPGTKLGITTTDIGVFYPWLLAPFLFGIRFLIRNRKNNLVKIILILVFVAPIPAGLTGDLFYPLRTLDFLWAITLIISFGFYELIGFIRMDILKIILIASLTLYSLAIFSITYFVLFKYEEAATSGEAYIRLIPKLMEYPDKKIIVDFSNRAWGVGIRTTYLAKEDPFEVQKNLSSQMITDYYSGEVNAQENFIVKNIVFQPLDWNKVCGKDILFVGDLWSFSPQTVEEHGLKLEFTIDDYLNEPVLFGYSSTISCK